MSENAAVETDERPKRRRRGKADEGETVTIEAEKLAQLIQIAERVPEIEAEIRRLGAVQNPKNLVYSTIEDGMVVGWDTCRRCSKHITQCTCPQGPQEPDYITRWRIAALAAPPTDLNAVSAGMLAAEKAADTDTDLATTVDSGLENAQAAVAQAQEETDDSADADGS